jgi:hypothetical protein
MSARAPPQTAVFATWHSPVSWESKVSVLKLFRAGLTIMLPAVVVVSVKAKELPTNSLALEFALNEFTGLPLINTPE